MCVGGERGTHTEHYRCSVVCCLCVRVRCMHAVKIIYDSDTAAYSTRHTSNTDIFLRAVDRPTRTACVQVWICATCILIVKKIVRDVRYCAASPVCVTVWSRVHIGRMHVISAEKATKETTPTTTINQRKPVLNRNRNHKYRWMPWTWCVFVWLFVCLFIECVIVCHDFLWLRQHITCCACMEIQKQIYRVA